jgi:hypothetical protein
MVLPALVKLMIQTRGRNLSVGNHKSATSLPTATSKKRSTLCDTQHGTAGVPSKHLERGQAQMKTLALVSGLAFGTLFIPQSAFAG